MKEPLILRTFEIQALRLDRASSEKVRRIETLGLEERVVQVYYLVIIDMYLMDIMR